MGMSTHIEGFVPPDAEWRAKADAWRACKAAGVEPPRELEEFLGCDGNDPDPAGRAVDLDELTPGIVEWGRTGAAGYEIDLAAFTAAHPEIKVLRFFNCW
jgi:hypothetical protein